MRLNTYLLITLLLPTLLLASLSETLEQETYALNKNIPTDFKLNVNQKHFVFVGGFLNETLVDYFKVNKNTLEKDFAISKVTLIFPSSLSSLRESSIDLINQLMQAYLTGGKKPLVVIAHSKAGLELLQGLISNPALVSLKIIEKAVLVQPAIGGSAVADLVGNIADRLLNPIYYWKGLHSLKIETCQNILFENQKRIQNLNVETRNALSDSIYYVRSRTDGNGVSLMLLPTHLLLLSLDGYWMRPHSADNDGMVMVDDQIMKGIGNDLGILDADHIGLLASRFAYSTTNSFRRAFTRALVLELYSK